MDLPLDILKTFVVFAQSPNIVEAAKRLKVSQPGVSSHLKRLESFLPQPVFQMIGRKKALTRYGEIIFQESKKHLENLSIGLDQINLTYVDPKHSVLKIAGRKEVICRLAGKFKFPGKLKFYEVSSQKALDGLLQNRVDIAFHQKAPDSNRILARPIFSEGAKLCVHSRLLKGHDGDPKNLYKSKAFLSQVPAILYRDDAPKTLEWLKHIDLPLEKLRVGIVCSNWDTITKMIEAGLGWSVVPAGITSKLEDVTSWDIPKSVFPIMTYFMLYTHTTRRSAAFQLLMDNFK